MKNYFYVEIAGSPYLFEKIVVVGGEYKFYAFYVDSGHPVAGMRNPVVGGPGALVAYVAFYGVDS
jgi:hypothetical protein